MGLDLVKRGLVCSVIFEDNNGVIANVNAPRMSPRTKHLAVKYHFFKDKIGPSAGHDIYIQKVESASQKADIFTKGLPFEDFKRICGLIMGW